MGGCTNCWQVLPGQFQSRMKIFLKEYNIYHIQLCTQFSRDGNNEVADMEIYFD